MMKMTLIHHVAESLTEPQTYIGPAESRLVFRRWFPKKIYKQRITVAQERMLLTERTMEIVRWLNERKRTLYYSDNQPPAPVPGDWDAYVDALGNRMDSGEITPHEGDRLLRAHADARLSNLTVGMTTEKALFEFKMTWL